MEWTGIPLVLFGLEEEVLKYIYIWFSSSVYTVLVVRIHLVLTGKGLFQCYEKFIQVNDLNSKCD